MDECGIKTRYYKKNINHNNDISNRFISLHLIYKHTDIWLRTDGTPDAKNVKGYLEQAYSEIENYVCNDREFLTSLHPCNVPETAPDIIKLMSRCSKEANIGPMSGVAGAIAEYLGRKLSYYHPQIICNNGGDIYYQTFDKQQFIISAPGSPFHNAIKIQVPAAEKGKGLCTSSGVSGHSINMGMAYAVCILAENACMADVWATAVSNQILSHQDIENGLESCTAQKGIEGVLILVDQYLGAWGNLVLSMVE